MRTSRRFNLLIAGLVSLALIAAACSSDGSSTDTSTTTVELTGEPIRVMQIAQISDSATGTPVPETLAGAQAAADSINASGGIDGRPIEIISCDDKGDKNEAAACARDAVAKGVVATVGNNTNFGDAVDPILEEAGIASIGPGPLAPADFSSPISFPLTSGLPGAAAGTTYWLAKQGATKIGPAVIDVAGFPAIYELFAKQGATAAGGVTLSPVVPVPVAAPDYAPLAASATSGNDAVQIAMNADQALRFLQAVESSGFTGKVGGTTDMATADTLEEYAEVYEGKYVVSGTRPVDAGGAGVEKYLSDLETYAPDAPLTDFTLLGWMGVQTFDLMIENQKLTTIDAASVLKGMGSLTGLDIWGFTAPLTTTTETSPAPLNRMFNPTVWVGHYEDGKFVLDENEPINPFPKS